MENTFLRKLTDITEAHLSDPDFGVDQLAHKMNMSYSSLWRRVSKYTGKSANQLIKEIRLTKAMEILQDEDVPISEVAYRTGFSSPNYFSTCFQDFFGYSPGELKKLRENDQQEIKAAVEESNNKPEQKPLLKYLSEIKLSGKFMALVIFVVLVTTAMVLGAVWSGNQKMSISVLYPVNLSHDTLTESFCGGLQDQLFNELFRLGQLVVRGRVSTDQFREKPTRMPRIGRKLNANYIVESSANRADNDIFVNIKLSRAKEDKYIWSKTYPCKFEDIFTLQAEIASDAAREIKRKLLSEKPAPSINQNSHNPEAESYFKQGNHYSDIFNLKLEEAYDSYTKAIEIESSYAEAYLGLAYTLNIMYSDIETRNDTLLTASLLAIERAEELNSSLPGLHNQRGIVLFLSGKFSAAVDKFKEEHGKNPESTEFFMNISRAYMSLGMWNNAENFMNEYYEMESYSTMPNYLLGYLFELQRDFRNSQKKYQFASSKTPTHGPSIFGRAETLLKSGKELSEVRALLDSLVHTDYHSYPDSLSIDYEYAILDIYQGRYQDAIERFSLWDRVTAKSSPLYFRPKYLLQAQAYGYMNEYQLERQYYDSARVFIEDLQQLSESIRNEPRVTSTLGISYAGLGQKEKALDLAKKTIEMLSVNPNAWLGPYAMEDVAFIYTKTGMYSEAINVIRQLLSKPGPLTISLLEIDPRWVPLRKMTEYRKLKTELL